MKKPVILFLFLLSPLLFSCAGKLLLPYEEETVCNRGVGYGYCGRLSDIYEDSVKNPYKYGIKEDER